MINVFNQLSFNIKMLIAVVIQVIILLFLILSFGLNISTGTKVYLQIAPLDPTDPLRGDYVTFSYKDISTINTYKSPNSTFRAGEAVYISLMDSGGIWRKNGYNSVSKSKPNTGVFIKGIVETVSSDQYDTTLQVSYGIEQYFIPESSGRNINFLGSNVIAEVYLDKEGNPILKQLFKDGKQWP